VPKLPRKGLSTEENARDGDRGGGAGQSGCVNSVRDGRPEGRPEGRLAATPPDPAWEGAVVDDSSPGSPRSMKCGRVTGPNRIID
jgi:hypothetical protein